MFPLQGKPFVLWKASSYPIAALFSYAGSSSLFLQSLCHKLLEVFAYKVGG